MKESNIPENKIIKRPEAAPAEKSHAQPEAHEPARQAMLNLQQQVGNRAVQRLVAQRSGGSDGPTELDDATAQRIQRQQGSGQELDKNTRGKMENAFGSDFSQVRVHNSSEAGELNQSLNARAFTTGQDVFFGQGQYDPNSQSGQKLLAHELTHVVQQQEGRVPAGPGGKMQVNSPNDSWEKEAENMGQMAQAHANQVQRQEAGPEEEELVQRQEVGHEEEEELVQRQEVDPEEEEMQG
jgi:hypothetical protein